MRIFGGCNIPDASPKLVSVSAQDVEDRLLAYFAATFPAIPSAAITAGTDLKQLFNYKPAAWAALALTLNALDWMQQINVRLAPSDMGDATTLGQLVALIMKRLPHVVAPSKHPAVQPLPPPAKPKKKGK